jgi:ABC-type transport system involved in multi-copper enzyme maturation permease subunit
MMTKLFALAGVVIREMFRRKDFYVVFILTAVIVIIMGSVTFFNDPKISGYLKELALMLIWLFSLIIAITTAARQIPAERESGTIFPLLAKPVTRNEVIFGKFLGCWLASGIALLVFYLFFGCIEALKEPSMPWGGFFETLWLHWSLLGVVISMAMLGSIVFAAPSSNATICLVSIFAILVLGRHLNKVALGMSEPGQTLVYTIYYVIPHLELFDVRDLIVHRWPPAPLDKVLLLTLYGLAYSGAFLTLACIMFRRKPLK